MRRLFLTLLFSLIANAALAQNPTCPTRPPGQNDNSCASTAFVQNLSPLNIMAFGGDPTNTNDNTTAFNNAITARTTTAQCIKFPSGKYKFNSGITVSGSFCGFGDGQDNTILTWPNAAGGITVNYAGAASSVHIRDMTLTTGTTTGGNCLNLQNSVSNANPAVTAISDVFRVTCRGDDGYAVTDFWTTGLNIGNVSNIQIETFSVFGASTPNGTGIALIGLPGSSTYGVQYNIAKSTLGNLTTGVSYGSFIQGVTIDQTNFTSDTNGISIPAAQSGVLAQLAITNSQFNVSGTGIVFSTTITEPLITNNLFIQRANSTAINIGVATDYTITGNAITASSVTGTNGIITNGAIGTISGNVIAGFATGLTMQSSTTITVVSNNSFSANTVAISSAAGAVSNGIFTNPGFNPVGPAAITVTASPFTYTAGASPESVYIFSGTVSAVTFDKNGGGLGTVACGASPCMVELSPWDQVKVTYTVAPSMNKMIH